ncbi:hypothetical protein HD554DRAFT_2310386 [Boletus coccyginus]|nr:hypothetical protein HD554DRAFT_2310386 [Boletus coccyginus]
MGEQSTSPWIVDLVWTSQVERNGTRVDTPDLAAIKAQPENTFPQQPESSSISMPPKTRSQTARSRPPNSPSLATLEEELRNLDVEDDGRRSPQPPSPDYDPADERREAEGLETRTTPKIRKKTRTVTSSQKDLARSADPNDGRCLITNRPEPVQSCHLVAQATDHETLTKLEYAWGLKYRYFNVDTRYNMMHLRNDWHFLFDQPKWILVPEIEVLQKLSKIYVEDKYATSDITKIFAEPTYRYYVLPALTLREPICRYPDVNKPGHEYFPPYSNLGPLTSHIHPHFVIFNAGKKLASFESEDVSEMILILSQIVPSSSDAISMVIAIQRLYRAWMGVQVPDHFYDTIGTPKRFHHPSDEGRDDHSQGGAPRRQGPRSATRSGNQGTQASAGHFDGGQQRAVLPFQAPEDDDSSSITDDTVVEDDTAWIEYIHNWQKQGKSVAESWGSDMFHDSCDEQLAAYTDEHARTPPSPGAWDSWKPTWDGRKSRYPSASDRAQFSSNDWAAFKNDVYLTRPNDPQVTT